MAVEEERAVYKRIAKRIKTKLRLEREKRGKKYVASRLLIIDFIALLLLEPLADRIRRAFELDRVIREAGLSIHPMIYSARVSAILVFSIILGISMISLGVTLYASSIMILSILVTTGILLPIIVLAILLLIPISMVSSRRHSIESELPFFAAYASFMARGSISLARVFERFSIMPLFRGMMREARLFLRETRIFGRDPLSALEKIASTNPSAVFRDFIMGYTTILRVGGDVVQYLESKTEELFTRTSEKIKSVIERMSLIVEIYMIISVVTTLSLFVLFVSAGGLQIMGIQGGVSSMFMGFYMFLILPLMSIFTIIFAHYSLPRQPVSLRKTFENLVYTVSISAFSGIATLILLRGYLYLFGVIDKTSTIGLLATIGTPLVIFSLTTYMSYRRDIKTIKELNEKLTSFLEDISEARKVGLSPERAIIQTIKRDYGQLSPIIRRIAVALSVGIDLEKAIKSNISQIKSWFGRVMFRFLIDSIRVGGGSPEVLYSLARYSKALAELEKKLRTSLRTYLMLPYIAAIMLSISSTMFLMMILQAPSLSTQSSSKIDPATVYSFITMLGVGIIINSWIMGFVAGKTAEMSLGEGLKHSAILALFSLISLVTIIMIYVNI